MLDNAGKVLKAQKCDGLYTYQRFLAVPLVKTLPADSTASYVLYKLAYVLRPPASYE